MAIRPIGSTNLSVRSILSANRSRARTTSRERRARGLVRAPTTEPGAYVVSEISASIRPSCTRAAPARQSRGVRVHTHANACTYTRGLRAAPRHGDARTCGDAHVDRCARAPAHTRVRYTPVSADLGHATALTFAYVRYTPRTHTFVPDLGDPSPRAVDVRSGTRKKKTKKESRSRAADR